MRVLALFVICLVFAIPSNGQSCYLQQDCGAGNLCSASGTCQPVRSVLDTGSNTLFWVDQASGNDANPGTESQPFRSITRAMQSGTMRAGDAVLIRQGTYYEPIIPSAGGSPGQRLTIAGYPGESVVISGAINLDGTWSSDGNAYRLSWPYEPLWNRYEGDSDPFGPARRRDVLIADGVMLQAVYNRSDLYEGAFFLEGSPYNPTTMYVMLPGGKDPNQAVMQTSRYNHLFNPSTNETNCRFGDTKGYYHVIGLTFRHTANDGQMGAVCAGTEGSILENITVEWTNGSGFLIAGNNHIVRGVTAQYNGMSGIRGIYCDGCLLEHATSRYNNWKGYYRLWESGGGKWLYTTRSTFRNLHFHDNEGPGLWLDMDNFDNVIEQSRFDGNRGANVFLEWTTERTIVRNNVITRARYADSYGNFYGHGLLIHAANNNMIVHNTFMGNAGGGMRIRADDRDSATNNRYYNNLFIANQDFNPVQLSSEISYEEHRGHGNARSNEGGGNAFWYRSYETHQVHTFQYRLQGSNPDVRTSTISSWQSIAETDYSSWVADLNRPHVSDTSDVINGWRLVDNSQFLGTAVPMPGDIPPVLTDFDGEERPANGAAVGADQPSGTLPGGDDNPPPDNTIARVQLLTFLILQEDNNVGIFWEAANEQDLVSYEVQRSQDGDQFTTIQSVPRGLSASSVQSYTVNDPSVPGEAATLYYRIQSVYRDGSVTFSLTNDLVLDGEGGEGEDDAPEAPSSDFRLEQMYPNPATNYALVTYRIPESSRVRIVLYDLLGRELKTVVDIGKAAGAYQVRLDTSDLLSGIYYVHFSANKVSRTRKLTVVR